jgi:hypothetical protein
MRQNGPKEPLFLQNSLPVISVFLWCERPARLMFIRTLHHMLAYRGLDAVGPSSFGFLIGLATKR